MADKKNKPVLPKAEEVASAKPILESLQKRQETLAKAKAEATEGDKFNKYLPKYRVGLKKLKRTQRRLRKELKRVMVKHPPKEKEAESK